MTSPWMNEETLRSALKRFVEADDCSGLLPLDLISASMAIHSDLIAFEDETETLTFRQVAEQSIAFASFLQADLGVMKGDHIALMVPNMVAFPVACFGILKTGAVQVNVNPNYTATELRHQLRDSGATALVIFEGVLSTFLEIAQETDIEKLIIVSGEGLHAAPNIVRERASISYSFADALSAGLNLPFDPPEISSTDRIFLQYTGGTTGVSKGAVLTHGNVGANILQFHCEIFGALAPGKETIVTALPLYHIFALTVNMLSCFVIGSKNMLVRNPSDMNGMIARMKDSQFSFMTGVNTLFEGMMKHPDFSAIDLSRYKFAMGGGTPILAPTSAKWEEKTGANIKVGYGLSETSPVVTMQAVAQTDFTTDCGKPLPYTDIRLLTPEEKPAEGQEPGELCVKGPQVTSGYWKRDADNAQCFTADGYFRTGDIAIRHPDGRYEIVDRKKDMILVSGFNVYPNEIEAIVAKHEGIAESICVGVADERTGEAVKVFAVRHPYSQIDADAVIAHCRAHLTGYKVPKHIEFRESLPKSAVGKLLRKELKPA